MFPFSRNRRAQVAAITAVIITALSVAVPLLDQGRALTGQALSQEGTPAGYVDHHHGVCLQHSAAAWTPAAAAELPVERFVLEAGTPQHAAPCLDGAFRFPHHSRAPPIV